MLGQRRRVRVEAGGDLHIAPEQLHHAAPSAPQVEHPARRGHMAANDGFQLVAARAPAGPDRAIALAVGVLDGQRKQRPVAGLRHVGRIVALGVSGRNLQVVDERLQRRLS
jgi:hypothetical protein